MNILKKLKSLDLFNTQKVAQLEKELSNALMRTHFDQVATNFTLTRLPADVYGQIVEDMKPYVVPEFHKYLEAVTREVDRRSPYAFVAAAQYVTADVVRLRVELPSVTTHVDISGDFFR